VRSTALGAFERTHGRTQGAAVERMAQSAAYHAHTLAGPRGYLQSTVWCAFDCKITGAFERIACVRTQARNLHVYK
jgi:hypothetical protein